MVAGVGLRRGCKAAEIVALVRSASAGVGRPITELAAPAFKRREAGLAEAARILEVDLLWVDDQALRAAKPLCVTHSSFVERVVGHSSIAEASALAAAGPNARLLVPRVRGEGVTCAIAAST